MGMDTAGAAVARGICRNCSLESIVVLPLAYASTIRYPMNAIRPAGGMRKTQILFDDL